MSYLSHMQINYLPPATRPAVEGDCWMVIERDASGCFFGTGAGKKPTGEAVLYASLPRHDVNLEVAIKAACEWAEQHGIDEVQVQRHGS